VGPLPPVRFGGCLPLALRVCGVLSELLFDGGGDRRAPARVEPRLEAIEPLGQLGRDLEQDALARHLAYRRFFKPCELIVRHVRIAIFDTSLPWIASSARRVVGLICASAVAQAACADALAALLPIGQPSAARRAIVWATVSPHAALS
jgi:hypothetical protein